MNLPIRYGARITVIPETTKPPVDLVVGSAHHMSAHHTEAKAREEAARLESEGWMVEWGRRGDESLLCTSEWVDALVGNPGWIVRASR